MDHPRFFALTGPARRDRTMPVRGDLAHVRLAGLVFVPHYAAPMAHVVRGGAQLRARPMGDVMAVLAAGAAFDVLDIAGGWCWGECGVGVGYVAHDRLVPA